MEKSTRSIELLAPARTKEIAIEAIKHGADAVYIGARSHGARAAAGNSIDDISHVVDFAHQFGARVYTTVNTLIFDNEIAIVENLIKSLYRIGVDALIVQDMGVLRLDIPPIELHASTQCDIRTPQKAKFLESLGFSQLVLARELSLEEIASIHKAVDVPLECFVHGALCVSYSGRCQASEILKCRSANRGECAQICRLPYDLVDNNGRTLLRNKHLLSLRDLNQSERIAEMLAAGVSSFKIEGRLKDMAYVKNVVAYYRQAIDRVIAENPDKYSRSSAGISELTFTPDPKKSFNRSFTHYFLDSRRPANGSSIASIDTPKSLGEEIGSVESCRGKSIRISSDTLLHNGDGISYFSNNGEYCGFRVNKATANTMSTLSPVDIPAGTRLFRTFDKSFEDAMLSDSASRYIPIEIKMSHANGTLSIHITDVEGFTVTTGKYVGKLQRAQTSQAVRQRTILSKLGNTIFRATNIETLDDLFIPSSLLTQLRRDAIDSLTYTRRIRHKYGYRRKESAEASYITNTLVDSDNVSNKLAEEVYRLHGVTDITPAIEVGNPLRESHIAMQTRYCIRRELGACIKDGNGKKLPEKLFLRASGNILLRVECDCKNCEMRLYAEK